MKSGQKENNNPVAVFFCQATADSVQLVLFGSIIERLKGRRHGNLFSWCQQGLRNPPSAHLEKSLPSLVK